MVSRRLFAILLLLGWISLPCAALAQEIEIIHTNDLHSHFEHSDDPTRGGYAAVKATIDRLKAEARAEGVPTLTLDAGDFSEGTPLFMADQGVASWSLIQHMGYDAITLGNHDWLVGPAEMERIIERVHPQVPILSANFHASAKYKLLNRTIQPHVEFTRAGVRIAVVGLSTNELVYRWRVKDGTIRDPIKTMKQQLGQVRANSDVVIALTHLGVDTDVKLAKHVDGVDLIVGGHSHTILKKPVWVTDPVGSKIPIVQTGAFGEYVGDLRIDYEPGKPIRIVHYRLIPVFSNGVQAPEIAREVQQAERDFQDQYGTKWLSEPIGYTNIQMLTPMEHPTYWGDFFVESIREAVHADIGLDDSEFFGSSEPAGFVTRRKLMDYYPRFFDIDHPMGWTVWTIHVPGWLLDMILKKTVQSGSFFNLANCHYDVTVRNGHIQVSHIQVGGRRLDLDHDYRVAVTEGIGRGSKDINWLLKIFFRPEDSGIPVWTAVEDRMHGAPYVSEKEAAPQRLPSGIHWKPAPVQRMLLQ